MLKLGPATLVAAAFIGPGTVVTASVAGASFRLCIGLGRSEGPPFAIVATMILQEMSARVGVVTQRGLGENLRTVIERPSLRLPFYILVIAAVVIGNAAYQGGNLTGASIGAEGLLGTHPFAFNLWAVVIGAIAVIVLWQGKYKTPPPSSVRLLV